MIFKKALGKTTESIQDVLPQKQKNISKETFEEILLESDVNYELVEKILENLPSVINRTQAFNSLITVFHYKADFKNYDTKPFVEMIIGVNGAGKTTTISKLAYRYLSQGKSVILGAGDKDSGSRYRAAEPLGKKTLDPNIATSQGHDPSAVVFDTISSAAAKNIDHVIIDTAGRLHTQTNLAGELQKMVRIADKALSGAPHRKLLVLDGTQGSSSINQARAFNEMVGIDGIIITKLDGTAKGGSVLSIAKELQIPILFIGTGEKPEDPIEFKANEYVNAMLDQIFVS